MKTPSTKPLRAPEAGSVTVTPTDAEQAVADIIAARRAMEQQSALAEATNRMADEKRVMAEKLRAAEIARGTLEAENAGLRARIAGLESMINGPKPEAPATLTAEQQRQRAAEHGPDRYFKY